MQKALILGSFIFLLLTLPLISAEAIAPNSIHGTNFPKLEIKNSPGGSISSSATKGSGDCITQWVFDITLKDWIKEDYIPQVLKNNPNAKGWKPIPGKYCVALNENGKIMPKPIGLPKIIYTQ